MRLKLCAKLSLFFTFVASVLLIVGITTPCWLSANGRYQGLWVYCFYLTHAGGGRQCLKMESRPDYENWLQVIRALEALSFIASLVSMFFLFLYVCRNDGRPNLTRIRVAIVLSITSFLLCMVGIGVYGSKKHSGHFPPDYKLSWSFALTALGGTMMGMMTAPLVVEIKRSRALGNYESI